jgi:hypothetical protein
MSDREKAVQFMRDSAWQLRRIAGLQSFLAPRFLEIASGLEQHADELETDFKGRSRETLNEEGATESST